MSPLSQFQCHSRRINEQTAVVEIHGDLDIYSSPQAKVVMADLLAAGCRYLLINLQHADYLDSTALGAFVGMLKRARELGGDIRLIAPSHRARRLLEITRLTMAFGIDASEQQALTHVPNEPAISS